MARVIGIRHRVKKTAKGEARPTMVAIEEACTTRVLTLDDDDAEKDFLLGVFPTSFRAVEPGENVDRFPVHHLKFRRDEVSGEQVVSRVPDSYDGLRAGDSVAMLLGGSGDRFAAALMRRGEEVGAKVYRLPPFVMKERRGDAPKDDDYRTFVALFLVNPAAFREMSRRDWDLIRLREAHYARREAMRARIGCEQRLRQQVIGRIFLNEEGRFPEGTVEAAYDREKANDEVYRNLLKEEKRREAELKRAVKALPIWPLFEGIEGCGENIAAGIIAAVGDIRLFPNKKKFKAFCGVHVDEAGAFPCHRRGKVGNWQPKARQALYLLGDQFNRRPDSFWGKKLRAAKERFQAKHPEVITIVAERGEANGKDGENGGRARKLYTKLHIHQMATWRTLTKFAEWLYGAWKRTEEGRGAPAPEAAGAGDTR